jgi:spermidine/putrescine transport system substrate-binding protein
VTIQPDPSAPRRSAGVSRRGLSRRDFLQRAALASLGLPAAGLLSGCLRHPPSTALKGVDPFTSPQHPATWPITADNPPIADNQTPERNATLQLYNYADYIDPHAISSFEKKYERYNVSVAVSTFNDEDEAITKIRAGAVPYDVYFPSYDSIGQLVVGQLLRPLNHSYLSNIENVWASFQNPWYDRGWRYTVPYTVYTTGIGWRVDQVPDDIGALPNPYDTLWNPRYRGQTAIIDDWHTAMALCLLRAGIHDVNTARHADLEVIHHQLDLIVQATSPKVTASMYSQLPAGQLGQCQMWSGDAVNAQYYLPKGTPVSVLRYWFPQDGRGMVDNDLMVLLRGGHNPVLAHLFLQHMLDTKVAKRNFGYIGYQPPQRSLDTAQLVGEGYVPKHMAEAVVQEEWFDVGYRLLELSEANDAAWHLIWLAFNAGA